MAGIGRSRRSGAIARDPRRGGRKGDRPETTHETAEKQVHEAREAEASGRERLVDIGRGRQEAGRQG